MAKQTWKPGNMLYPLPAVMVSVTDGEGNDNIITVAWAGTVCTNPPMVSISVRPSRFSYDMLCKTKEFVLNLTTEELAYATDYCGVRSGRDVDKFANITAPADENAVPYLGWQTCSVLSAKVVSRQDLGTHTLFIAEVTDAKLLSNNPPLTYADYQAHVKPKPEQKKEDKKIIGWRCKICNYVYEGSNLPEEFTCPLCGHGADDFEPIYENA